MIPFSHSRTISQSLREYGRGVAGGLMFSVPLLYTQEVWQSGILLEPWRILLFGAVTYSLLLLYNRYSGLREDASMAEVAIDSVEEMGIGFVLAALVLALTGRIDENSGGVEALGTIVMEATTVAIGVSVGTAQLGAPDDGDEGVASSAADPAAYFPQMAIALCGAVLFAANVAPTEEIVIIASESSPARLLGLVGFSLGICALVFSVRGFSRSGQACGQRVMVSRRARDCQHLRGKPRRFGWFFYPKFVPDTIRGSYFSSSPCGDMQG